MNFQISNASSILRKPDRKRSVILATFAYSPTYIENFVCCGRYHAWGQCKARHSVGLKRPCCAVCSVGMAYYPPPRHRCIPIPPLVGALEQQGGWGNTWCRPCRSTCGVVYGSGGIGWAAVTKRVGYCGGIGEGVVNSHGRRERRGWWKEAVGCLLMALVAVVGLAGMLVV